MATEDGDTPEWEDVIREAIDGRLVDVHTSIPARAETDRTNGVVDVKPLIQRTIRDDAGRPRAEALPVIPSVPVATFRASGSGAFVSVPVKKGDHGLLVFSERSIDRYRALGKDAPPGDNRTHPLAGAVFWPGGIVPKSVAVTAEHADDLVIGFEGGSVIHVKPGGEIHLGSETAADQVVTAAALQAAFTAAIAAALPSVVAGDGGAAVLAALDTAFGSGTAGGSSTVKADD